MEEINPHEYTSMVWDTNTNQPLMSNLTDITDVISSTGAPVGSKPQQQVQADQQRPSPQFQQQHASSSSSTPGPGASSSSPAMPSSSNNAGVSDASNISTLTSFNLATHRSPFEVTIAEPQKHGEGLKEAYVSYLVTTRDIQNDSTYSVRRRFTDFVWLHTQLTTEHPAAIVCPLPDKHRMEYITGDRFSAEFVDKRRVSLQRFLNRITRHPILQTSPDLRKFLTMSDWSLDAFKQSKREGIMDNLSDAIMNTFSKLKKPDERFVEIKENVVRLEENLQALERHYSKVIKKHVDLEHDIAEFGSGVTTLGVLETDITDSMTRVGAILYEQAKALSECTHHEDVDFSSHIKDYLAYCAAVKYSLKVRDHKQLDYEVLSEALSNHQAEVERLRRGGSLHQNSSTGGGILGTGAAAGQAIGYFFKEKYEEMKGIDHEKARQDRIGKLESKIKDLTQEVSTARDVHVAFSDEIAKEIDFFQAARSIDFKEIFSEYADGQIQYFQKSLRLWESMVPVLEAVDVDE